MKSMIRTNIHTWARIRRFDLQHAIVALGNAALRDLRNWPSTGEGRATKALAEQTVALLDYTFDGSGIDYALENFDQVMAKVSEILGNPYYQERLQNIIFTDRQENRTTFAKFFSEIDNEIQKAIVKRRQEVAATPRPEPKAETPAHTSSDALQEQIDDPISALRDLNPGQNLAPLQFEFSNGRLRLRKDKANEEAPSSINALARDELIRSGQIISSGLANSNCDRRLTDYFIGLHEIIDEDGSAVKLGLASIAINEVIDQFAEEVPGILLAQMRGYAVGVGMYVSQFPSWSEFVSNAAMSEVEASDSQKLHKFGQVVAEELAKIPELVDPEVPKSISLIAEALRSPPKFAKRAIFGFIRSLENLVSVVFGEIAQTILAAAKGVQSGTKLAISASTAAVLLTVAVNLADDLAPTALRITKSNWLSQAAEIVRDAMKPSTS